MRVTKTLLLLLAITISRATYAQEKQFTIAEATNGIATTLAPKGIKYAAWQPGTDRLWQVEKDYNGEAWTATNYSETDEETTFKITKSELRLPETMNAIPEIKWVNNTQAYYMNGKKIMLGAMNGHSFAWQLYTTLPDNAANLTIDKFTRIYYTAGNNLWMLDADKQTKQVTAESDKNIVCGQSVYREEFGITTGIFPSPAGNALAYYRMDQTMVNDYPIIKWDTVPATVDMIKYPMAGGTSHEVTLRVYNPQTAKTITMQTGDTHKDHYLTCVTWSPDEKYIYIAILNRAQNHLWLNQYDAATGEKTKTLFEETSDKYVHPTHPLTFIPGRNDEFIWWSERDGYEHLYLYNTSGKLIRQLTKGEWVVNEIAGIDKADKKIIITASKESPLDKNIYTVSLDNGKLQRIDKAPGMHTTLCSDDGEFILDAYSNATTPKNTVIHSADGKQFVELLKSPDPLADYARPETRDIKLKASDGTPLYGKLILPVNFNSAKKYPVIVYLYNGPNVQLLHNSFPASGSLWYEYMAQRGYIVFTMDGRGSWNRGLAFEQATFHHLGEVEMQDQLQGVAYLKSLPYTDTNRFGLHGWSFGGFMTTSIMLKHPGVFKCAVSGGTVTDWKMYEVMYTERYMGTPQNNPEGYERANLLDKTKNLKGKLLLIHGTNDDVVVWQHSIDFIKKCVDENVQVDYFVYPGYQHNVRGKDRVHLMQKITDYFDENLK